MAAEARKVVSVNQRADVCNHSLRTTAVSSPGTMRNLSPTWTTPLHNRPDTPTPDDTADCPLNTLDIGYRRGNSSGRAGTSTLSINRRMISNDSGGRAVEMRTQNFHKSGPCVPSPELGLIPTGKIYTSHSSDWNKCRLAGRESCGLQEGAHRALDIVESVLRPVNLAFPLALV